MLNGMINVILDTILNNANMTRVFYKDQMEKTMMPTLLLPTKPSTISPAKSDRHLIANVFLYKWGMIQFGQYYPDQSKNPKKKLSLNYELGVDHQGKHIKVRIIEMLAFHCFDSLDMG